MEKIESIQLLIGITTIAFGICAQIALYRFKMGFFFSFVGGFILGIGNLILLTIYGSNLFETEKLGWFSLVNFVAFMAFYYHYFVFAVCARTSLRIRILAEIVKTGDGISLSAILDRYQTSEIIEARLKRLLQSGQVVEKSERYWIGKPWMLNIAKLLFWQKRFILGRM